MSKKSEHEHNLICDPDGPWGPVYDSPLIPENYIPRIRFIENQPDLTDDNLTEIVERIRTIFSQFKHNTN